MISTKELTSLQSRLNITTLTSLKQEIFDLERDFVLKTIHFEQSKKEIQKNYEKSVNTKEILTKRYKN